MSTASMIPPVEAPSSGQDLSSLENPCFPDETSSEVKVVTELDIGQIHIPLELPIAAHEDEIIGLLKSHPVIVVAGDTGSGKSTQLPKLCLKAGFGHQGLIGHTQPRRIAAKSIADRIAQELGDPRWVGYQVRFQDRTTPETRIKLMTDGILLAEIQRNPLLKGYQVMIIDEAHERTLNIDFLLGYLKRIRSKRPDLRVIITSATIDHQRFSAYFEGAPLVQVAGRMYPVEIRYSPPSVSAQGIQAPLDQSIARVVRQLFDEKGPGDVLVFLSTEREIHEVAYDLREFDPRVEICKLFGRQSLVAQQKVFSSKSGKFRFILATNVAETSVTVPGIRYVLDGGFARVSRYFPKSKVQGLPIEAISQASAQQRAGRCGRVGPGVCVRLYDENDFQSRAAFTDPEILRTHLAGVILQMHALRLGRIEDFDFLDPPDTRAIRDGLLLLKELGALTEEEVLTHIGRQLSKLPLDPRLGRMLVAAKDCRYEVLVLVARLSLQDPRERPMEFAAQADQKHAQFMHPSSDFLSDLRLWEALCEAHQTLSHRKFRAFCEAHFLAWNRVIEWFDLFADLKQRCIELGFPVSRRERLGADWDVVSKQESGVLQDIHYRHIHQALLAGLLSHIAVWDVEKKLYHGARQIQLKIFPGSALKRQTPAWIMGFEVVETRERYLRHVAVIDVRWIESIAQHRVKRTYRDPKYIPSRGAVFATEQVSVYGLMIVPKRSVPYQMIDPVVSRQLLIAEGLASQDPRVMDGPYRMTQFAFFRHQQALWVQATQYQHQLRRQDIRLSQAALIAFYEQNLPADVTDFRSLKAFVATSGEPSLYLKPEQVILLPDFFRQEALSHAKNISQDERVYPEVPGYPAEWKTSLGALKLMYYFEAFAQMEAQNVAHSEDTSDVEASMPLGPLDGATVEVPLSALMGLTSAELSYGIPGYLPQKVEWLLRQLPKSQRVACMPMPETVQAFLETLQPLGMLQPSEPLQSSERASLYEALKQFLKTHRGIEVNRGDDWAEGMPTWLTLHVRVLSAEGACVAQSDDLAALQSRWGAAAQRAWDHGKSRAVLRAFPETALPLKKSLPRVLGYQQAGEGYVALQSVAEGSGVSEVLLPREDLARAIHREGILTLLKLGHQDIFSRLERRIPEASSLCVMYAPYGSAAEWRAGMIHLALLITYQDAWADDFWEIRSTEAFEALLDQKETLVQQLLAQAIQLKGLLQKAQSVKLLLSKIKGHAAAYADLQAQLSGLLPKNFLMTFPICAPTLFLGNLGSAGGSSMNALGVLGYRYSAYLSAMEVRCQRLLLDPLKDAKLMAQLTPFLKQELSRLPQDIRAQWPIWLEEFRIALFAQPMKTAFPVSEAKLKAWLSGG